MARNQTSKFGAAEGLLENNAQQVQQVRFINAQDVHEVQEVKRELGTTQGKKGQKAKRINMAFSDANHEYITKESRKRGMTSTAFVNSIIDEYKKK